MKAAAAGLALPTCLIEHFSSPLMSFNFVAGWMSARGWAVL